MLEVLIIKCFLFISLRCCEAAISILSDQIVDNDSTFGYYQITIYDDWTFAQGMDIT